MHLQAKQSISPNNSPNVSQALRAGKYMIMVKGHGKKAWRWRGLRRVLVRVPGAAVPSPPVSAPGTPGELGWTRCGAQVPGDATGCLKFQQP